MSNFDACGGAGTSTGATIAGFGSAGLRLGTGDAGGRAVGLGLTCWTAALLVRPKLIHHSKDRSNILHSFLNNGAMTSSHVIPMRASGQSTSMSMNSAPALLSLSSAQNRKHNSAIIAPMARYAIIDVTKIGMIHLWLSSMCQTRLAPDQFSLHHSSFACR